MKPLIAPSLLSADFLNLRKEIEMINQSEADWLHLDIMDGVFVPNISFGFSVIRQISAVSSKPLDVHLMIVDPDRYLERFAQSGAAMISVHYEACTHLHRTIHAIRNLNIKAGVVLNPHTPAELVRDIANDADFFLIMSVNPGFGGQKFIERSYAKISRLKEILIEEGSSALIEVDGGVDLKNAGKLVSGGADILVAGNSVFSSPDPAQTIHQLKNL